MAVLDELCSNPEDYFSSWSSPVLPIWWINQNDKNLCYRNMTTKTFFQFYKSQFSLVLHCSFILTPLYIYIFIMKSYSKYMIHLCRHWYILSYSLMYIHLHLFSDQHFCLLLPKCHSSNCWCRVKSHSLCLNKMKPKRSCKTVQYSIFKINNYLSD